MQKRNWFVLFIASAALSVWGCSGGDESENAASRLEDAAGVTKAVAVLHPTAGNQVHGTVVFMQQQDGVHIVATIGGLAPGEHGFHIHEFGDCSADDGTSAGGHYNPQGVAHAGPDAATRHVGDLGNITADDSGEATLDVVDTVIQLNGPHSIIGRGLIVHANPDDLTSQPTGNAGGRVACGVIGIAKGE